MTKQQPSRSLGTRAATRDATAEFAASLRLSVTRLARRLRQQDRTGLGPTMTAALASVHRHGSPSHGELAALEGLTAPTITAVVDKMVALGLATREVDERDRRVTRVRITAHGVDQLDGVRARRTEWLEAQLHALPPADLRRLADAADVLARLTELPDATGVDQATDEQVDARVGERS